MTPPLFKPPRVCVKPRCRVKRINWCLLGLYTIASFLHEQSPKGPPSVIVEKVSKTKAVYIIGTTLHVHLLNLRKRDELNSISLTMHFCLVNEVRIHCFEISHHFSTKREHVRIAPSRWEAVEFVLPYINKGPWVECKGKRERVVKITFDDYLKPAIKAWRASKPYAQLVSSLREYETDLITRYSMVPDFHAGMNLLVRGYSSESEGEVDILNDTKQEFH